MKPKKEKRKDKKEAWEISKQKTIWTKMEGKREKENNNSCIKCTLINNWFIRHERSSRYEACGKLGEHERCSLPKCFNCSIQLLKAFKTHGRFCIFGNRNDVWTNCFLIFSIFFSTDLFPDVTSVHNRNMKHARAVEIDYTNLLAML